MRILVAAAFAATLAAGCSESVLTPTQPETITAPLLINSVTDGAMPENHRTHLSGNEEVPARATQAQGQAVFQVSPGGQSVHYTLMASNIENVTQAHIHCGPAGANGPIVVWLYPGTSPPAGPVASGRHDGVLAENTFTDVNVIDRDPGACPGGVQSLADVLARIRSGNAYVNVHTDNGVAPANEGPGDFPGGEIRGQIE